MAKIGRPSPYGKHILVKARRYLNMIRPCKIAGVDEIIPTVEGLSLYLKVNRDTVYAWEKEPDKKDFSDIVRSLMSKQGVSLISGGLSKRFDAKIAGLMLSKHGYKEKVDVTTDDQPINASGEAQSVANRALDAFLNGEITRTDTTDGK